MAKPQGKSLTATCQCGHVALVADGAPIVSTACYCTSCQKAGEQLEALPGAPTILDKDGGTNYVLFRKDRVRCVRGQDDLHQHRLAPDSKTRRVVATCCNSAMFVEFTKGHWLTLYRKRLPPEDQPPLEMRVMTKDRRAGVEFADKLPSYASHSGRFMWRLLLAWAAMGFRSPKINYVKGEIDGRSR